MKFETLKDKMYYYRSLSDNKLMPKSYVLMMLDGKKFSSYTKKFKKPFDEKFINAMNETAIFLCKNIEGVKIAYTQSDEISLLLTDFEKPETNCWFDYRLSKMLSIAASLATAKFNQLMALDLIYPPVQNDAEDVIKNMALAQFDCKAWNVPTRNDAIAWFCFRQNDCIRNSVSMVGNTYFSHKELMYKNTDVVKEMLLNEKNIDWSEFPKGQKQGRIIVKKRFINDIEESELINKENLQFQSIMPWDENIGDYIIRNRWVVEDAPLLSNKEEREIFEQYVPINNL